MDTDLTTQRWIDTLRLPALPKNVLRLRGVLAREDAGVEDAANVIAQDPSLTARVLRVANSAQFAPATPLVSVHRAATTLGLRNLYRIALRVEVVSAFSNLVQVPGFDPREIWRHAILTAQTASDVAQLVGAQLGELSVEEYYSCGLLHDIGQIVMFDNRGAEYAEMYAGATSELELLEAEEARYQGLNHADLGSLLAAMWELPAPIPEMIRFHHEPGLAPRAQEPLRLIAACDEIANCVVRYPHEDTAALAARLSGRVQGLAPGVLHAALNTAREHSKTIEI